MDVCHKCGEKFTRKAKNQRFCSLKCKNEWHQEFHGRKLYGNRYSTFMGAVAEMRVACMFLDLGYNVFKSVSEGAFCDLVVTDKERFYAVEVKTGYRSQSSGNLIANKPNNSLYDVYAVYVHRTNEIALHDRTGKPMTFPDIKQVE